MPEVQRLITIVNAIIITISIAIVIKTIIVSVMNSSASGPKN